MNVQQISYVESAGGDQTRKRNYANMKPGDLIQLNNQGNGARVIPDMHPRPRDMVIDFPPGTVALILEVHNTDERDGPSMESYAKVFVNGYAGFVYLYECEELR